MNQYCGHTIFGKPTKFPYVANLFHLLWTIGQHSWDIKNNSEWQHDINEAIIQPRILILNYMKKITVMDTRWKHFSSTHIPFKITSIKKRKCLTRQIPQLYVDWDEWNQQLDQYCEHNIFGKLTKLTYVTHLLHLL